MNYQKMAAALLDTLVEYFPAASNRYDTADKRLKSVNTIAPALEVRQVTRNQFERIIYWMGEYGEQWPPSVGQMLNCRFDKTPMEIEQDRAMQSHMLDIKPLTESQREFNKHRFAELLESIGENKNAE